MVKSFASFCQIPVYRLAEEIRKSVLEARIPHAEDLEDPWVTISQGVSCQVPGVDDSLEELIHMADEALYQAKATGRNRVCSVTGKETAGHQ